MNFRHYCLQERTGNGTFESGSLVLQYKLDNEFELVYVAGFQKVLQLSYVDKFLNDIQREIRDRYKNVLGDKRALLKGLDVKELYEEVLRGAEIWSFEVSKQPKVMRSFEESKKSKKTVASMIDRPGGGGDQGDKNKSKKEIKNNEKKQQQQQKKEQEIIDNDENEEEEEENDENVEQPNNNFGGIQLPSRMTAKGVPRTMMRNP